MKYIVYLMIGIVFLGCAEAERESKEITGFVELGNLYSDFGMKKELEAKLLSVETMRQNMLDSMEVDLKMMMNQLKSGIEDQRLATNFQLQQQNYLLKQEQFEKETANLSATYTEQIWNQINQYVNEFGKENNYTYIHGADGGGSVMYAADDKNITEELSKYINEKYKG